MSNPTVDRCVCHQVLFADMLPTIVSLKADSMTDEQAVLDHLRQITKCTTGCAMCAPYIRQMIRTHQSHFVPLSFPHE
ncbi:MAG: (2Fe-2S)-binding protein [Phycisphaerales bacterium]